MEDERLVAVGETVAGVAHELNTPVGVAVSGASFLLQRLEELQKKFDGGGMTEEDFTGFLVRWDQCDHR